MRSEKRKSRRKSMRYSAWIQGGSPKPFGCVVADISDSGARLDVDEPDSVPYRFILLLSKNGHARRICRTVWRSSSQIGVQFEQPDHAHAAESA
jgi:PilZ domain-containing protein